MKQILIKLITFSGGNKLDCLHPHLLNLAKGFQTLGFSTRYNTTQ